MKLVAAAAAAGRWSAFPNLQCTTGPLIVASHVCGLQRDDNNKDIGWLSQFILHCSNNNIIILHADRHTLRATHNITHSRLAHWPTAGARLDLREFAKISALCATIICCTAQLKLRANNARNHDKTVSTSCSSYSILTVCVIANDCFEYYHTIHPSS